MVGRRPSPGINWSTIIAGVGLAWTMFVTVLGGLMVYAYLNGATSEKLTNLERRVEAIERGRPDGGTR